MRGSAVQSRRAWRKLKTQGANSSGHTTRALLLAEPPSVDGGEITDKGLHQPARRADASVPMRWRGCMMMRRVSGSVCSHWQIKSE